MKKQLSLLLAALTLSLSACGGSASSAAEPTASPAATEVPAPTEAPAESEAAGAESETAVATTEETARHPKPSAVPTSWLPTFPGRATPRRWPT